MNTQRLDALAAANAVRTAKSVLKADLAAGTISLADAMEDPRAASATVRELLRAQKGWGPVKTDRALRRLSYHFVWPNAKIRRLTAAQRELVVAARSPRMTLRGAA